MASGIPTLGEFTAAGRTLTARGSKTGNVYTIDDTGFIHGWYHQCIQTQSAYSFFDYQRSMYVRAVALKLLIETDEREFWRVAGHPGRAVIGRHEQTIRTRLVKRFQTMALVRPQVEEEL